MGQNWQDPAHHWFLLTCFGAGRESWLGARGGRERPRLDDSGGAEEAHGMG